MLRTTKMSHLYSILLLFFLTTSCGITKETTSTSLATDDIASAINQLKSGNQIQLKPKTYTIDVPIEIRGKEDITIDGNGATIIMNKPESDVFIVFDSNNITLKNFKATHIEASGPTGCTGNVVHIERGANILIEKCELNGSGIVGIAAYKTENLKVTNNHIHKNSEYGIIYQGPSIQLENNIFENNGNGNLYYSHVEKNGTTGWPPNELINENLNKTGLIMSKNVFR